MHLEESFGALGVVEHYVGCVRLASHLALNRLQSPLIPSHFRLIFLPLKDQLVSKQSPRCIQALPVLFHEVLRGSLLLVMQRRLHKRLERLRLFRLL